MGTKINQITKLWKPGLVFTSSFLKQNGINYDQQLSYKKSGWLESIGNGAFKRDGDRIGWPGSLYAIQKQLVIDIHLGGKTALLQHGFSHYAYLNPGEIFLFTTSKTKVPKWFSEKLLSINPYVSRTAILPYDFPRSYTEKEIDGFEIKISTPERAFLELLYFVPKRQGFDEAQKIMNGLTSLRPDLVQNLLEMCSSIKVKRLFLFMAENANHFWFNDINIKKIDQGKGKRLIVGNGRLDKKYNITVPR
jgi:transcriptional regulator with AbiEi antitoxin domain of type IV toxin-antitoxin system